MESTRNKFKMYSKTDQKLPVYYLFFSVLKVLLKFRSANLTTLLRLEQALMVAGCKSYLTQS